jgi:hypothetical protein
MLGYVNRLWGGPDEADRLVSEANHDWGQGLKELARWQRPRAGAGLKVWYFGTDPAAFQPPFDHVWFDNQPLRSPDDLAPLVRGNYLAVSTYVLAFHRGFSPATAVAVEALKRRRPIARTSTFLIYDFTSGDGAGAAR